MDKEVAGFSSTDWDYENLEGNCSVCGKWIVANRSTDLDNALPAVGRNFKCRECGTTLHIYGDTANHPIDLLLFGVFPLKLRRRYIQVVFALTQAVEIAMSICVEHVLVIKPLETDMADQTAATDLSNMFNKRLKNMTFDPLRNLVTKLAIHGIRPSSAAEARRWISEMNNLARDAASADLIAMIGDPELRQCVEQLRALTVGALRNDVAHHLGRRPTEEEVEQHETEVKPVVRLLLKTHGLTPLGGQLVVAPAA